MKGGKYEEISRIGYKERKGERGEDRERGKIGKEEKGEMILYMSESQSVSQSASVSQRVGREMNKVREEGREGIEKMRREKSRGEEKRREEKKQR